MDIENGTFTTLVFSVNGVMSKECSMFHKYLAQKFANKTNEPYEEKKLLSSDVSSYS